jgi:pilus assembly protein Flp/PilA
VKINLRSIRNFGGGFMKFWKNEKGQGLTEYALIIALVAIVAVAALTLLGGQISGIFGDITTDLGGAA